MKKILVAALLLLTNLAIAQMPDIKKGVYVTDNAHVLTPAQLNALNQRANDIYKHSGFQLIIVVMDALPKGINVNDATTGIDEKWKISSVDTTNRLIYVAGIKQHGHRLKPVRGVKAALIFDKQRCTNILTAMKPSYDLKDYNGGLNLMMDSVATVVGVDSQAPSSSGYSGLLIGVIFILCVLIAFVYMRNRNKTPVV